MCYNIFTVLYEFFYRHRSLHIITYVATYHTVIFCVTIVIVFSIQIVSVINFSAMSMCVPSDLVAAVMTLVNLRKFEKFSEC